MECKIAQKLVMNYISGDMNDKEMEQFLKHIESCEECYEELEINYTIYSALMQLDDKPSASYDMKAMLSEELKASLRYVRRKKIFTSCQNALYIVSMVAMTIIVIIQIKLWT